MCYVISHDQIHLDIFYFLTTTPKSVDGKHPYVFSKFNKRLIAEFGMCKNTCISVWSFSGSSSRCGGLRLLRAEIDLNCSAHAQYVTEPAIILRRAQIVANIKVSSK